MNGRNFEGERYSPLRQIDTTSVAQLGFAWEFRDFVVRGRTHRGLEANPILSQGVLYFSGPWGVAYAVEARSGKPLWTYDPGADGQYARSTCCDVVSKGVAVWQGKVFTASLDGFLVALDARTGKVIWRVDTFVNRKWNYTVTAAPHIAGDNILIGNAGGDMGARGYVSAYDVSSGRLAWRFWIVPGNPADGPDETPEVTRARGTWSPGTRWELGIGGGAWDDIAYDPSLNLAYIGTGNGSPHPSWLRSPGGGDNLYLDSIVAVDATSGRMKWYYQETPGDSWDYDATSPMVLGQLQWQGHSRKVLLQASKNGIFYVLDRVTGEVLRADAFTPVSWTDGIDLKTGRPHFTAQGDYSQGTRIVSPTGAGGHGWQPMAYSPLTGLVYFPVYDTAVKIHTDPPARFMPGFLNQAESGEFLPPMVSRLKAWNPLTGRAEWVSDPLPFVSGGTLVTAGGVVFQGASNGVFSVYDAANGHVLKRIETGTSIMPAPMTYEIDGVQYVAVLAGAGGPQSALFAPDVAPSRYQNFERLLVLKLGGGAVPLPGPAQRPALQPAPAAISAPAQTVARGKALFEDQCRRCHVEGGALAAYPNLWNMTPGTLAAFDAIVRGGAFQYAGMASFADVLTEQDVAAIKAFIVGDEIARRAAHDTGPARPRIIAH